MNCGLNSTVGPEEWGKLDRQTDRQTDSMIDRQTDFLSRSWCPRMKKSLKKRCMICGLNSTAGL